MKTSLSRALIAVAMLSSFSSLASGALITNAPMPIDSRVTVQPIIVSNNDGSNTADFFGTPSQESEIINFVDTIWAQAGIDIDWLAPNNWNNTFANIGTGSYPRPSGDLSSITASGDTAGVGNADPFILDMYFVQVAAGFAFLDDDFANGLAFVGGNGITQHVGSNLLNFTLGRELIASVVAHEIGHNLGLNHIGEAQNLMEASGSSDPGERLSVVQISDVRENSNFVVAIAVPEPSSVIAILAVAGTLAHRRRRKS